MHADNSIGGLVILAQLIQISLPDKTFLVLKELAECSDSSVEEAVERAVSCYIRRNRDLFSALRRGYAEMGDINLELAEEFLGSDNETLMHYEEKLSESE